MDYDPELENGELQDIEKPRFLLGLMKLLNYRYQ
jgi:hypothetical protein